jgi:uncharacterized protein (DUF58 family)
MAALFDRQFIEAIGRLRIVARQVAGGGRHAEQRSRDLGSGMEFRDFRAYVAGDDTRRVDWNLYRRSGRLFLRLFEELEDLPVYILVDVSESMFFEVPPRADAARQIAGLIAGVSLNQLDRTGVFPFGRELGAPLRPTSGKRALPRVLDYLERLRAMGPTDLPRVIRRFGTMRQRSGLAVVVSDFFDPGGIGPVIEALRSLRHRLVLVQVVRGSDAAPELEGELRLVDCETEEHVDVTITPASVERYRRAYEVFNEELLGFVARRRALHVRLDADRPVLDQIGALFPDGELVTRE